MRREDIALFIEIKKMKPLEVQIALKFFQEIKVNLSVESYDKREPSNPNENFHAIVARMMAQAKVVPN
tara:strand:+ start:292 stop:495 length:204 start_codon:yes stop_codon:yes gene_type:complete